MNTTGDERLQQVDLVPWANPQSDHYDYQPLPAPDWIRLLVISPSAVIDAPFACTMEAVPNQSAAEYCALSYSWGMNKTGDASFTRTIKIGNAVKPVTQNLFEALRHLRSADVPVRIWIDAVCIDQSNDTERTEQVTRMASVYKNASRVAAWLGEGESADDDAAVVPILKCMQHERTHAPREDHTWTCPGLGKTSLCRFHACMHPDYHPPYFLTLTHKLPIKVCYYLCSLRSRKSTLTRLYRSMEHAIAVLEDVLNRRYFSRRWIVQELAHANIASTHLLWGAESLPLSQFQEFSVEMFEERVSFKMYARDFFHLGSLFLDAPRFYDHKARWSKRYALLCSRCEKLSELLAAFNTTLTLPQWVSACTEAHLQCSDPRDLLYSLVSLDDTLQITPDYTKSTVEVYTNFAQRLIECGLSDYVFYSIAEKEYNPHRPQSPSWVPDLDDFHTPWESAQDEKHRLSELSGLCPRIEETILTYSPFYIGTVNHTIKSTLSDDNTLLRMVISVDRLSNPFANHCGPKLLHQRGMQEISIFTSGPRPVQRPQIGDIICTTYAKINNNSRWDINGRWDVHVLRPTKADLCKIIYVDQGRYLPPELKVPDPEPLHRIEVRVE